MAAVARRSRLPLVVGVVAAVAIAVGAALAGTHHANAPAVHAVPAAVARRLGPAPVTVTLRGSLLPLLSSPGVDRLAALESEIAHEPYVRDEYGPVTWLRSRLAAIAAAIAARRSARVTRADLMVRYGTTGRVSIDNQGLVTTLVFGAGIRPSGEVQWLFPDAERARIFVRASGAESASAVTAALRRLVDRSGLGGP
jgi:hypothetical protein